MEIDTRFFDHSTGEILDNLGVTWIDTLGASNKKYSYWAPHLIMFHEALAEAVEPGVHTIVMRMDLTTRSTTSIFQMAALSTDPVLCRSAFQT